MAPYSIDMRFPTAILAVNTIGLTLSFWAVVMRLWARFIRQVQMRLSDYTIIASWLFTLGLVISENYCTTLGGIGQDVTTVTPDQLLFTSKQFVVIGVCGSLAVTLVKISILDFFLSIFSTHRRFLIVAYTLMGITASYGLAFTVVTLAGCTPFEANWDKLSHPDYKCINTSQFYVAQTAIGAVLDILVLLLPMPVIWTLKLKASKKISLTLLFTIGILICAISMTRLVYNRQEAWMLTHFTEYAGVAALLGALEANLSIVCACLPTMPPLLTFLAEKIRSTFGSDSRGLRGLLKNFSYKNRTPTPGSRKLSSSAGKRGNSSTEDDLESARFQKPHYKHSPLTVLATTRTSLDHETRWVGQIGKNDAWIDTVHPKCDVENMEGPRVGARAKPHRSISVTRSWEVDQTQSPDQSHHLYAEV